MNTIMARTARPRPRPAPAAAVTAYSGSHHRDELLPISEVTGMAPTFEAGVYFMNEVLEIGVSAKNLAEQSIDYRLTPRAVQSLTGQGGDLDLRGLEVPIRIRGGFNNVSVGIDFEAVARDLLRATLDYRAEAPLIDPFRRAIAARAADLLSRPEGGPAPTLPDARA